MSTRGQRLHELGVFRCGHPLPENVEDAIFQLQWKRHQAAGFGGA